jgi:hypothetical protein
MLVDSPTVPGNIVFKWYTDRCKEKSAFIISNGTTTQANLREAVISFKDTMRTFGGTGVNCD